MFMTPHPHRDDEECDESRAWRPGSGRLCICAGDAGRGVAAGLFRDDYQDPDLLSQVFWSGVHGVAALHLIMGDDTWVQWRPVEEVARTAIDLIIRGLVRNGRGSQKEKRWLSSSKNFGP